MFFRLVQLGRQRCAPIEAMRHLVEAAAPGTGVDGVTALCGQQDGTADGGGVDADGAVVGDDQVRGGHGGPPTLVGRDEYEPGPERLGQPRLDLTAAVRGPDIGMQNEGDTEFVVGEFGEQPVHQFRIGPEEGIGFPGGVDRDEFLAGAQPEVFSVVQPAGRTGEEAVVAGVTGEKGEWEGVGAAFAQPVVLLVVGQRDGAGYQAALVFEGAVGKPEDLLMFLVPLLVVAVAVGNSQDIGFQLVQVVAEAGGDHQVEFSFQGLVPGNVADSAFPDVLLDPVGEDGSGGLGAVELDPGVVRGGEDVGDPGGRGDAVDDGNPVYGPLSAGARSGFRGTRLLDEAQRPAAPGTVHQRGPGCVRRMEEAADCRNSGARAQPGWYKAGLRGDHVGSVDQFVLQLEA